VQKGTCGKRPEAGSQRVGAGGGIWGMELVRFTTTCAVERSKARQRDNWGKGPLTGGPRV
jgi:hypothetical protein